MKKSNTGIIIVFFVVLSAVSTVAIRYFPIVYDNFWIRLGVLSIVMIVAGLILGLSLNRMRNKNNRRDDQK